MVDRKTFACSACQYKTNREYNYKVHIKSAKHQSTLKKQQDVANYWQSKPITGDGTTCPYCDKEYVDHSGLCRHLKKCKVLVREGERTQLNELLSENQKLLEVVQKYKKMEQDYRTLQGEHNELMKKFIQYVDKTTDGAKDMEYYMTHCQDPVDFVQLLETPLNKGQLEIFRTCPLDGIVGMVKQWCDSLVEAKRPIHCVDVETHHWIVYWDNQWRVDIGGYHFLTTLVDKIDNQIMLEFLDGDQRDYFLFRTQISKMRDAIKDRTLSVHMAHYWKK